MDPRGGWWSRRWPSRSPSTSSTGFHDAANSIAPVVSTRVLSRASRWCGRRLQLRPPCSCSRQGGGTRSPKIVHINPHDVAYVYVVLAALVGACLGPAHLVCGACPPARRRADRGPWRAGVAHAGWAGAAVDKVIQTIEFIPLARSWGWRWRGPHLRALLVFRKWRPGSGTLCSAAASCVAALYSLGTRQRRPEDHGHHPWPLLSPPRLHVSPRPS